MPSELNTSIANDPSAPSGVRRPRALVRVNDIIIPGWISWSVTNNTFFEADTFRVVFASNALPVANNANWFSMQKTLFIEILAGFPQDPTNPQPAEMQSLIYARADELELNPRDGLITLTGRDLTGILIDTKIFEEYQNKTASQIATMFAQSAGLSTDIVDTADFVGSYVNGNYVLTTADRSQWDVLAQLARDLNFVCFVSGQVLNFKPDPRTASNPYVLNWQPPTKLYGSPIANVGGLTLTRNLTVARGISVTVRSTSTAKKTPVSVSYPTKPKSIGAGQSAPIGADQQYYFSLPANATPADCLSYAQARYENIISHEMKLEAYLPADNILTINSAIQLQGTGTEFDQIYFPRQVLSEMSVEEGYRLEVQAQNTSLDESPST